MKVLLDPDLKEHLGTLRKTNPQLIKQISKQLHIFSQNPYHPSLRNHKITGKFPNRWSISITRSYHMIYVLQKDGVAYFVAIGTHNQVYRK